MRRRITLALAMIAGGLLSACSDAPDNAAAAAPPPVPAGYLTLNAHPLTLERELPGRTTAYQEAEVRPQVSGVILKRLFDEGALVEAGQALYQIDDRIYRATLASARADLARARATAENARLTVERYETLAGVQAVSAQERDEARARHLESQATVAAAEAALQSAQINLDYALIKAPISGRIGRSSVTAGALVTANQAAALTTIRQLDPIYVDVTQSHNQMQALRRAWESGQLQRLNDDQAAVQLVLEDGSVYAHAGTLQFSEYAVDERTSSVTLRALLPNPDGELLPGMYVRARLPEGRREQALLVPQKAVMRDPQGNAFAYVVAADNTAERRPLTIGRAVGNQWLVEEGLAAGDRLVVDGLQKIQPGATLAPVDTEADAEDATRAAAADAPAA